MTTKNDFEDDGKTGLYTDRLTLNRLPIYYELIAGLVTSMLKQGCSPKQFSIPPLYLISIPENKENH